MPGTSYNGQSVAAKRPRNGRVPQELRLRNTRPSVRSVTIAGQMTIYGYRPGAFLSTGSRRIGPAELSGSTLHQMQGCSVRIVRKQRDA